MRPSRAGVHEHRNCPDLEVVGWGIAAAARIPLRAPGNGFAAAADRPNILTNHRHEDQGWAECK